MESPLHPLKDLFDQLGLPSDAASIDEYIATHRPRAQGVALHDAPMWTPAQAAFLRDAIEADADWAIPVESLTARLCR